VNLKTSFFALAAPQSECAGMQGRPKPERRFQPAYSARIVQPVRLLNSLAHILITPFPQDQDV
jgi:hypothetical protein